MRFIILLPLLACTQETSTKNFNTNPEATITSHADGAEVETDTPINFRGQVSDANHLNTELETAWYVGQRNVCPWELANDSGETNCEIVFSEGDGNVVLEVRDPQGAAGRDEIAIANAPETVANETPSCAILNPQTGHVGLPGGDVFFQGIAMDDGAVTALSAKWSSDKDGELGTSLVTSTGEIDFVTSVLSAQSHTIALIVSDPEGAVCIDSIVISIENSNSPPQQPVLSIQPNPAYTDNDLTVSFDSLEDPDGDTLSLEYLWFKDGAPTGITGASIPASETAKNETWTVSVTPFDGEFYGPAGEAWIIIENHPPTLSNISISPSSPSLGDTLLCTATATDPDDSVLTLDYSWVNLSLGATLSSGDSLYITPSLVSRGDEVQCVVTATDGSGASISDSTSVIVENAAPSAPVISISPTSPTEGDDLICEVDQNATDMDGDPISYSIEWTVDSIPWTGPTTTTVYSGDTIPGTETVEGEFWACTMTPNDGFEDGTPATETVEIQDIAQPVTIDFEDYGTGTSISNQYLHLGAFFSGVNGMPNPVIHDYGSSSHTRVLTSHNWYDPLQIDFVVPNDETTYDPVQHISFDNPINTEVDYIQANVYSESGVLLDSYLSASPERIEFNFSTSSAAYIIIDDANQTAFIIDNLTFY